MKYLVEEGEFEGHPIDRIFTTDVMGISMYIIQVTEIVKESDEAQTFNIGEGGSVSGDPIIHDGIVYFGCCDKNLYAVTTDGKEVWRFATKGNTESPTYKDGIIYFGSFDHNMYAVDAKTGEFKWSFAAGDKIASQPIVHNDAIYFTCKDGNLYAISTNGKILWKYSLGSPAGAGPTLYKDVLYFGTHGNRFYAIGIDGILRWYFAAKGVTTECEVHENKIYFTSLDQHFYCLDLKGNLIWKYQTKEKLFRKPSLYKGVVYGGGYEGNLYAIDVNGNLLWTFQTDGPVFTLPCLTENHVYLGSGDNNVYCLDRKTGKMIWKHASGGPIIFDIIKDGERLFYGGWDCKFYCITTKGEFVWSFPTSLSYIAPVLSSPKTEEVRSLNVTWNDDLDLENSFEYKEKTQEILGGYIMKNQYIHESDYLSQDIRTFTTGKVKRKYSK